MGQHRLEQEKKHRSRRGRVIAATVGVLLTGTAALAAGWTVGLDGGSSAEGQSASITNLSISAVASPSASNLLYPGATGDVVLEINNPNGFPVSVTDIDVPANTSQAAAYTNASLTNTNSNCTASTVTWTAATSTSSTDHALTPAVTVAAGAKLDVTLTGGATMGSTALTGCANSYFKMPALTGVSASSTTGPATTGPVSVS